MKNIEIREEDLINIIAKWKNQKEFDINAGIDYYKFLEKYKKESKEEIREQISNMFKDSCMEFLQTKLEKPI